MNASRTLRPLAPATAVLAVTLAGLGAALAGCESKSVSTPPPPPNPPVTSAPPPAEKPAEKPADVAKPAEAPPAEKPAETPKPAESAAPAADAAGTGTIAGVVKLARQVEQPASVEPDKDQDVCGKSYTPRSLVVKDGALANVVVQIKKSDAPKGPYAGWPPTDPVRIDQKGCHYEPRIALAAAGQPVWFLNSDPKLHNIALTMTQNSGPWDGASNKGVAGGDKLEAVFKKAETILLGCTIHRFMGAALVVAAHPWAAVTDENGRFALANVPPGKYQVVAWHETLGTKSSDKTDVVATAEVQAGKAAEITLSYK